MTRGPLGGAARDSSRLCDERRRGEKILGVRRCVAGAAPHGAKLRGPSANGACVQGGAACLPYERRSREVGCAAHSSCRKQKDSGCGGLRPVGPLWGTALLNLALGGLDQPRVGIPVHSVSRVLCHLPLYGTIRSFVRDPHDF